MIFFILNFLEEAIKKIRKIERLQKRLSGFRKETTTMPRALPNVNVVHSGNNRNKNCRYVI
jgi:hypothetical protein